MRSISDEDMQLYAAQMEQIKARFLAAEVFLGNGGSYPAVESAILQVRQSLEVLVLSSLVSSRAAFEAASSTLRSNSHNATFKSVKRANPAFWPAPSMQQAATTDSLAAMIPIQDGFLREEDYFASWGRLSSWLHSASPFVSMRPAEDGARLARDVMYQVRTLLNHHTVELVNRDEMLACIMNERESGRVHVFGFTRVG